MSLTFTVRRGLDVHVDCNNLLHETRRYYRGPGQSDRLATLTDNAPAITFGISADSENRSPAAQAVRGRAPMVICSPRHHPYA